jgi:hypothetical protein
MLAVACIPTFMAGPLNGGHKINILCGLCGSAVKKAFIFNKNKKNNARICALSFIF